MKTLQELALDAGLLQCRDPFWSASTNELSRFRDLVLEEAALMAYNSTDSMHDERDMVLKEIIAEAIRAMKGQK
jgi:hypothetical protein